MHDTPKPAQHSVPWWGVAILLLIVGVGIVVVRLMQAQSADEGVLLQTNPTPEPMLLLATTQPAQPAQPETPAPIPTPASVVVYISGAVLSPDVYELPADARVKDVVMAAGGLSSDADAVRINLAAHIEDAQHIHVPRVGEPLGVPTDAPAGTSAPDTGNGTTGGTRININTASKDTLESLQGIGPVLAQRILDHRAEAPFTSVDDLQQIQGISADLLETIRPYITVDQE